MAGLFSTLNLLKVDDDKFGDALFIGISDSKSALLYQILPCKEKLQAFFPTCYVFVLLSPRTQYLRLFADLSLFDGAGSVANLDRILCIL